MNRLLICNHHIHYIQAIFACKKENKFRVRRKWKRIFFRQSMKELIHPPIKCVCQVFPHVRLWSTVNVSCWEKYFVRVIHANELTEWETVRACAFVSNAHNNDIHKYLKSGVSFWPLVLFPLTTNLTGNAFFKCFYLVLNTLYLVTWP